MWIMAVKNRLKEILEERGIKQTWLAEKAGIDRSTLNFVISNKKSTNLETGMRIARALDLKVEDIFEIVDE
jgi:DNA-binding XRE family transcriptional regulator